MRTWVLASCSSLFMSAAYTAFHYDATVRNRANAYSLSQHFQEIFIVPVSVESFHLDISVSENTTNQQIQ